MSWRKPGTVSAFVRDTKYNGDRDNVDSTAIRYQLDGPGIESRWSRDFQCPSGPALRPTQPSVQEVPSPFRA